jgi:hypothetical protein
MKKITLNVSRIKVMFCALVILELNGFVSHLIGLNKSLGAYIFSGILVVFFIAALWRMFFIQEKQEIKSFYYPTLVFLAVFTVSFISANFIFIKPLSDWLPSLYAFVPIFTFYFLYVLKCNEKEVALSFIIISALVSLLLFIDQLVNISFLDDYQRMSSFFDFGSRRIVLLKNEVILGFVFLVSFLINTELNTNKFRLVFALTAFVFFVQVIVMESRMGFLAMAVAVLSLMLMRGLTLNVMRLYILAAIAVFFVFPFVFKDQIIALTRMSAAEDGANISIRVESTLHFYHLFLETYGVGLGSMSSTGLVNNVLNLTEENNIVDIGAFSSLFQFGVVGFALWVFLTFKCLSCFYRYYNKSNKIDPYSAAVFSFLIAFTISLLPLSFFTSSWCIGLGGVLLYYLWIFTMQKNERV